MSAMKNIIIITLVEIIGLGKCYEHVHTTGIFYKSPSYQ